MTKYDDIEQGWRELDNDELQAWQEWIDWIEEQTRSNRNE